MAQIAPTTSHEIVVEGLLKSTGSEIPHDVNSPYADYGWADAYNQTSTEMDAQEFVISVSFDSDEEPVSQLWKKIEESGYQRPMKIMNGDREFYAYSEKSVLNPYEEVVVVGNSQPCNKNSIKLNETLISHANTHYGDPVTFNITNSDSGDPKQSCQAIKDNKGVQISFQRAPRMPDDNKLHQLPGTLGSYDLFNVETYSDRLPENIREAGGVFFPMWQREAMWLRFRSDRYQKCVVRVFVGRINAVSGLNMDEDPSTCDTGVPQDYVVIPKQDWLDGICSGPGVVRQFVAMPLGSGYTVEGQKTSEEKHGGLQIELTPQYDRDLRFWTKDNDQHIYFSNNGAAGIYDNHKAHEKSTPEEMGCRAGDILRSYPQNPTRKEPFRIKDLVEGQAKVKFSAHYFIARHHHPTRLDDVPSPTSNTFIDEGYQSTNNPWIVVDSKKQVEINDLPEILEKGTLVHGPLSISREANEDEELVAEEDVQIRDIENEIKNLKIMGIAAGGKLIQDIYKDPYPATIWNHSAARIIHVHILDPISFEKVTHIVPKPPPIGAKTYAEQGGQFYVVEEQVDERLEGGDFDNVKSVSQMDQHIGVTTEPEFDPMKPKICMTCEVRLCDCIIRPCNHQFCNVCIRKLDLDGDQDTIVARKNWKCPTCDKSVALVAGFSAPMNLPGEEPMRMKVPVNVLKIEVGRLRFSSLQKTRI